MYVKSKNTHLLVLAILFAMYANLAFAEELSLSLGASKTQHTNSGKLSTQSKLKAEKSNKKNGVRSFTWPLLPGENLNRLAILFYPDNKAMQKRFIENTLILSHDINPNFNAQVSYLQTTTIIIPELHDLSLRYPNSASSNASRLKISYRIASETLEEITPAMQAEYEYLIQRNVHLKTELDSLNQRIAKLQIRLKELKIAALIWLEGQIKYNQQQEKLARSPAIIKAPPANAPIISKQALIAHPTTPFAQAIKQDDSRHTNQIFGILAPFIEYQFWILGVFAILGLGLIAKKRVRPINNLFEENIKPLQWDFISPKANMIEDEDDQISKVFEGDSSTLLKTTVANHEMNLAVDKAQKFMSENKPHQAIELLQSVIHNQPKNALHPWLYLLDVYRQLNKKSDFIHLAKRFHATYNVMVPQWESVEVSMIVAMSLEEFPHVMEQITALWGSNEIEHYLNDLISDNRGGERAGFSISVLQELVLLKDIVLMSSEADLT